MVYRVFGGSDSPYSVKVRSYFRYTQIPHKWIPKTQSTTEEFNKYAKLPIVPLVVSPEDEGMQDSTPIIEALERIKPVLDPKEPTLKFLSEMIEEYGDEWVNKYMFHYRWAREVDQDAVSLRLAIEMSELPEDQAKDIAGVIKARMTTRGFAVGSNPKTQGILEEYFQRAIALLEAHLATRPFLFGGKPCMADFGVGPQIYQALCDPTAGAILRKGYPRVVKWATEMGEEPKAVGDFESWSALRDTMMPLLTTEISTFLKWSAANAVAIANKDEELSVTFNDGKEWWQTVGGPQKYHAKSLKELRKKFSAVAGNSELSELLQKCNCLEPLLDTQAKL